MSSLEFGVETLLWNSATKKGCMWSRATAVEAKTFGGHVTQCERRCELALPRIVNNEGQSLWQSRVGRGGGSKAVSMVLLSAIESIKWRAA